VVAGGVQGDGEVHRGDILGRRWCRSALHLDAGPTHHVPDRQLADQLRLVEAVSLSFSREVGQAVQGQPRLRALTALALDRLNSASRCSLRRSHPSSGQGLHRRRQAVWQHDLIGLKPLREIDYARTSTELKASLRRTLRIMRRLFHRGRW
jgi:hypothetical protein